MAIGANMFVLADLLPAHKSGVGWGGVLTFTHLRTAMMWRHGTFTCTCAHTSCYFEDVSRHAGGGVGWGGVLTFTHLRTGGIDAYWTLLKDGIPNSITSTVGGKPNKLLWMYMRSQQWRWECHDKDILAQTGQTLATLWAMKRGVRIRLVLGHKTL